MSAFEEAVFWPTSETGAETSSLGSHTPRLGRGGAESRDRATKRRPFQKQVLISYVTLIKSLKSKCTWDKPVNLI